MPRGQRFALVIAAVVALVVLFVVLNPGGEEDERPASATEEAQDATPSLPGSAEEGSTGETAEPPAGEEGGAEPAVPRAQRIRVVGGQPAGGVKRIAVEKGETVRIVVTSDSSDEVHLHGYDVIRDVAPGRPARFQLRARLEGIFEMELEGGHVPIAQLRVSP